MFFDLFNVLLLTASFSWTDGSESVPFFRKDYTYEPAAETYYKEHAIARTWSDAASTCRSEGAQLATPLTDRDVQFLTRLLTESSWVGIHDQFSEGFFNTLNGIPVAIVPARWRFDRPNDADGDEDCVIMYSNDLYDDENCNKKSRFLCTKHRSEVKPHTVCETGDKEYFLQPETDRCYKLHTIPKTWHEAYAICRNEEAFLAVINSRSEAGIFIEKIAKYPEDYLVGDFVKKFIWMGFSDLVFPGEFLTIYGESLHEAGYESWAEGQPDSWRDGEHCGSMRRDGRLNDLDCDQRAFFFCEKMIADRNASTTQPTI